MGSLIICVFFFFFFKNLFVLILNLFFLSVVITMFLLMKFSSWLGGLFFLMYVGAVLVVIYYIFSLSSKIILQKWSMSLVFYFFGIMLVMWKNFDWNIQESLLNYKFKDNILSLKDGFFLFFSIVLFLGLWISSKLQLYNSLALRIYF